MSKLRSPYATVPSTGWRIARPLAKNGDSVCGLNFGLWSMSGRNWRGGLSSRSPRQPGTRLTAEAQRAQSHALLSRSFGAFHCFIISVFSATLRRFLLLFNEFDRVRPRRLQELARRLRVELPVPRLDRDAEPVLAAPQESVLGKERVVPARQAVERQHRAQRCERRQEHAQLEDNRRERLPGPRR